MGKSEKTRKTRVKRALQVGICEVRVKNNGLK